MIKTYSIAIDTKNAILNSVDLNNEIELSSISKSILAVYSDGDILNVEFESDITTSEETTLTAIILSHEGNPTVEPIDEPVPVESYPFASKVLSNGKKLYKRIHGAKYSVVNGMTSCELNVPYDACKINGVEILGGEVGDYVQFKVKDTPTGLLSTVPNYVLNQFGFDVYLTPAVHTERSEYDADLIKDMKVTVEYHSTTVKDVYINVILHEVK